MQNTPDRWFSGKHLQPEAVKAYRHSLRQQKLPLVVLDDFFKEDVFNTLNHAFMHNLHFEPVYRVRGVFGLVSREEWLAAPEADRLDAHSREQGALSGHEMTVGYLTYMLFMSQIKDTPLLNYFSNLLGIQLNHMDHSVRSINPARGEPLGWHHDYLPQRKLCCIVYMHKNWEHNWGGIFNWRGPRGKISYIDPLPNRAIIFKPVADHMHKVGDTFPEYHKTNRFNYTLWFYG